MPSPKKTSPRRPRKGHSHTVRLLPPTPDYLQCLPSITLRARDWRRILKFVLRRVAVRNPSLAKQLARDVRIFHALRVSPPPRLNMSRLLPRWLQQDAPLIAEPTRLQFTYYAFMQLRDALDRLAKDRWPAELEAGRLEMSDGRLRRLPQQTIGYIVEHCRTAVQAALEAVACLDGGKDPDVLAGQFARNGWPLRPFTPKLPKRPR